MSKTSIDQKLSKLPNSSGVYFHKNSKGEIIYVGKAAVIKNRVRQYFQNSRTRDPKTEALVREIKDIEWIETESEIDALFLEAELIKRYKPRFNILERDDRSDLYVRIDIKSDHPTVSYTRRPLDDSAEYFGPFQSALAVKRAMKLLRKVFPFDQKASSSKRVSLNYHLGLSPGLEEGLTSLEEYRANLKKLIMYLKGNRSRLAASIKIEMNKAAKAKEFEKAAQLRNQWTALNSLNKQIVFSESEFMDISKDQALNGLAELLTLPVVPRRIEGYDISHQSGTNNVASMVVFTNGIADKRQYRKFKMRLAGNDDFAHMREVISRRFSSKNILAWPKPDLILIDGGKGQLSAAMEILQEQGIEIPAIGLAKRQEDIIRMSAKGFETIRLPKSSHIVRFLQRIRDEAHRFAVSYHSSLKTKGQSQSILEEIPTIGPATRKKLINQFGSVQGIMNARKMELEKLVGPKKTALLIQYLRPLRKEKKLNK